MILESIYDLIAEKACP